MPDELVWEEIYINLELAKPPNLMKVLNWHEKKTLFIDEIFIKNRLVAVFSH